MKRFISWPCVLFCLFFLIACAPKTAQLSQTTPSNKLIVNTPPTSPISKQNSTIISATSQNKQVLQQTSTKHLTVANAEPVFVPYRQKFVLNNGQLSPYLQQWAEFVAQDRNIPLAVIEELLKQVRYDSQVINLMAPAQVKKSKRSWSAYKAQFVEPIRIDTGLRFWQQHQQIIDETSKKYQIPASILVAIIGVETIYGRYTGNFKVLNALTNLGFSYPDPNRPERAAMFREQLADFIELHYQNKVDALQAKGSYAGAMGLPQFMPTSIKKWAIDAENKGRIDLWGSIPDSLASIANFLNHHGWQAGWPIFIATDIPVKVAQSLVTSGLEPTLTKQVLRNNHIALPNELNNKNNKKAFAIIDLVDEAKQNVQYRLVTRNFFALTAYNRSYFYASAVVDLACELEKRFHQNEHCTLWAFK